MFKKAGLESLFSSLINKFTFQYSSEIISFWSFWNFEADGGMTVH